MITFECPHCAESYTVPVETAGKTGQCATCHAQFTIPAAPEPVVEAPVAGGFDLGPVASVPPPAATSPSRGGFDLAPAAASASAAPVGGDVVIPPPLVPPAPPRPAPGTVEIDPCPRCGVKVAVVEADIGLDVDCPECKAVYPAVRPGSPAPAKRVKSRPVADRPKSVGDAFDSANRRPRPNDPGRRSKRADDSSPTYGYADDDDDSPTKPARRSKGYTDLNDDDDDRPSRRSRRTSEMDRPISTRGGSPRHRDDGLYGGHGVGVSSLAFAGVAVVLVGCVPLLGAVPAVLALALGIASIKTPGRVMGFIGMAVGGLTLVATGVMLVRDAKKPSTPPTQPLTFPQQRNFGQPQFGQPPGNPAVPPNFGQPNFGPPNFGPQPGQRLNPRTGRWE